MSELLVLKELMRTYHLQEAMSCSVRNHSCFGGCQPGCGDSCLNGGKGEN